MKVAMAMMPKTNEGNGNSRPASSAAVTICEIIFSPKNLTKE
jgi:hypothetical protein